MSQLPVNLRVNDCINPVGVGERPYFGWHIHDKRPNQTQTHYQILVAASPDFAADGVWDSGQVAGDTQNHVVYGGRPLPPNTRCYWTVRTWDNDEQPGEYAAASTFTTGLFTNEDWAGAQWIKRDNDEPDDYTYYRKKFALPGGEIEQAVVYVTAVHQYTLYLNGHTIGQGLAYHYPQYQYYNAYDITGQLVAGADNLLAVFTHWFGGGQGRPASERGLLLKVIVDFADGRSLTIGTDASWRCHRAGSWLPHQPPRHAHEGIGYVEAIDAAQLIPDWPSPHFEDAAWPPVTVIGGHPTPPWLGPLRPDLTRIVEYELKPVQIWEEGNGRYLLDLGQIYPGRPRIQFRGGQPGQEIAMQGGYTLNADHTINQAHNQGTDMRYFAISNGGDFTFLPQEYLGMRYFEVVNSPMPLTADTFTFLVRHVELDSSRSYFTSDHAMLNQVWDFLKRSITVAAQEQFLDTPTREKGGFLVDSLNESLVAMAAFGERPLTQRTLHEFLDSMEHYWSSAADWGRMNAVYPNGDGPRDIPDFTQAYLVWVWHYYLQTADAAFLQDNYDKLKAVADFVHRHRDDTTGLIHNLTGGDGLYQHGIIDWPPTMRYGYDMTCAARTVNNAYAYADDDIMAKIAAVLGQTADQQTYRTRAEATAQAINQHLLTAEGIYCDGLLADGTQSRHAAQQANTFPLALGITPPQNQASVLQHIQALKMSVGMPTVYYLLRAVGEMGAGEHLLDLYTRADWDGWAKNMAQGATCTWEGWDSDQLTDQSLSHPWGAVGLLGIQEYVLGVQPLAAQYARVQLKPLWFGARLHRASGKVPTERGDLAVAWQRENGRFTLTCTIPPNMKAAIYLPTSATNHAFMGEVGSGTHHFTTARPSG
ncbi:MAG: family 78 glycoside hydrolase catalytic domain [Ardenticatenaceae bacterium]|nr:family 78 glycoside hydrolase catalytic domain [Ardenticatenaceae bacterium]